MRSNSAPPIYFLICTAIIFPIYFLLPQYAKIAAPYNWLGLLFVGTGLYLNLSADRIMKKHGTPHKFEKSVYVIEEGVFKLSRNPMYLGMTVIILGFALISKNVVALISPLIFFFLMNMVFIPYEEAKMTRELGENYLKYREKVRRWI